MKCHCGDDSFTYYEDKEEQKEENQRGGDDDPHLEKFGWRPRYNEVFRGRLKKRPLLIRKYG